MEGNFLERAARSVNGSADETTDSSQRVDTATFESHATARVNLPKAPKMNPGPFPSHWEASIGGRGRVILGLSTTDRMRRSAIVVTVSGRRAAPP